MAFGFACSHGYCPARLKAATLPPAQFLAQRPNSKPREITHRKGVLDKSKFDDKRPLHDLKHVFLTTNA